MSPILVTVGEIAIRIIDQQLWLYATTDLERDEPLHLPLFSATTTILTEVIIRRTDQKYYTESAVILVDDN